MSNGTRYSSWRAFLRLWLAMFFSYLAVKLLFNYLFLGRLDLRFGVVQELLIVPLGQSAAYWLITRRARPTRT